MFYERFKQLCKEKGVSTSKAAIEAGLSKSTVTKWKKDPTTKPSGNIISKLCAYFDLSVAELLGETENAPAGSDKREVTQEDIKFALFGGSGEITDAMYDEVLNFAAFVRQREASKKERQA